MTGNDLITITAGELMDRQFLPRHTVVENFLPAGTFILSGQPKIGKSFLMLMLCWCVCRRESPSWALKHGSPRCCI